MVMQSRLSCLRPICTARLLHLHRRSTIKPDQMRIAVVGAGISGAVCASSLAREGVAVTVFDSGRGPGGRTSHRRETAHDGGDLSFDHGAPCFIVSDGEVAGLVAEWEARGLVAAWKERFGSFDKGGFVEAEEVGVMKRYVGVPGMNSMCKALCSETGIEAKFGVTVGKLEWVEERREWSLMGLDGSDLGCFDGVIASDKNVVSSRFTGVHGKPPPLDISKLAPDVAVKLHDVPVRPCFALMLAFSESLSSIPFKAFSFKNSNVLSWAFCDSSKPGRSVGNGECWVLHSTADYATSIITKTGLQKPSSETLSLVAGELFQEFRSMGLHIPQPFFMRAHRWGSAFPAVSVGGDDKCLFIKNKKMAICGDFCASPNVEGAILSGKRAASKLLEMLRVVCDESNL
ncbi:hypothetical protein QJS10_CPB11g01385 [Acorus calamus]|uniref:FAD/NAD(P)-binding oxidoreductase family protein n=1 Tax=Acorus calamus TaxID=4465 RepID=A0AAV9DTG5_ACOCL|nr:hypothetical protein QJS10_CPB11g01385 [Acorus calamus]